eukprot:1793385-Alexandrium_andersonii.AAC.1
MTFECCWKIHDLGNQIERPSLAGVVRENAWQEVDMLVWSARMMSGPVQNRCDIRRELAQSSVRPARPALA